MTDNSHPAESIERVVVDPDDVVQALERNARDETEPRTHVLRVNPPIGGEQITELHVSPNHAEYQPEMDPTPIHISPETFVTGHTDTQLETSHSYPSVEESRDRFREEVGEPAEHEDEWEEWWDEEVAVWEAAVRADLCEELTLTGHEGETTVEVRYD